MSVELGSERIIFTDGLQPFVIRSAKGTLFVQAQLRFPPGYVPAARNAYPGIPGSVVSRDGGQTWARWVFKDKKSAGSYLPTESTNWNAVLTPAAVGPIFEGAAVPLRNGPVLLQEWIAPEGPDAAGWYDAQVWESHDDLETFEGPIASRIHLPEGKGGFDDGGHPYSGLTFHRTILELPGGDLLACCYCWFKGDDTPCPYQPKMMKFRCVLLRSADRARTWRYVSTIAVDPSIGEEGFNEPAMARLSKGPHSGRLVCLLRTGSNNCPIYQAHSDDEGRTWSKPRPMGLHGVDPDVIEMADGSLLALVGRRVLDDDNARQRGYYLALSRDAGESWQTVAKWNIEPHAAVGATTYYGALRELEPGKLLAVYDVGFWTHPVRYIATREIRVR